MKKLLFSDRERSLKRPPFYTENYKMINLRIKIPQKNDKTLDIGFGPDHSLRALRSSIQIRTGLDLTGFKLIFYSSCSERKTLPDDEPLWVLTGGTQELDVELCFEPKGIMAETLQIQESSEDPGSGTKGGSF